MKVLVLFIILFSSNLMAMELGEDPSNVDCVKSIHGSRPYLATIKQETSDTQIETSKPKEVKTIQK